MLKASRLAGKKRSDSCSDCLPGLEIARLEVLECWVRTRWVLMPGLHLSNLSSIPNSGHMTLTSTNMASAGRTRENRVCFKKKLRLLVNQFRFLL